MLVFDGRHSSKQLLDGIAATFRVLLSLGGTHSPLRQPKEHASFTLPLVVFTASGRRDLGIQEEWKKANARLTWQQRQLQCMKPGIAVCRVPTRARSFRVHGVMVLGT